jgi:hypothetical protein
MLPLANDACSLVDAGDVQDVKQMSVSRTGTRPASSGLVTLSCEAGDSHTVLHDADDQYLLQISNEEDFVAVDDAGFVHSFRNLAILDEYAELGYYSLEFGEPVLHYLEWILRWTGTPATLGECAREIRSEPATFGPEILC